MTDEVMACVVSSGGSPAACNSPYCYNDAQNPPVSSPQCSFTSANQSFALDIPQLARPLTPSLAQQSKANTENFNQGVERLQHLFAKSYSVWVWNEKAQCVDIEDPPFLMCTGKCNITSAQDCWFDSHCPSGEICNINEQTIQSCRTKNDCNFPDGECSPPGGGACVDATESCPGGTCDETGDVCIGGDRAGESGCAVMIPYTSKKCESTCMGGSCVDIKYCGDATGYATAAACMTSCAYSCDFFALDSQYHCTTSGQCKSNPDCSYGTCLLFTTNRCSNNIAVSCNPIDNCAPVLAANGCPGYAFCNNPIKKCVGGTNNGNSCTFNQDCPGGSCR